MNESMLGVVIIGRNEGERLRRCLVSVLRDTTAIVYVDSGSTDDSVACCRNAGAVVVELKTSVPFTAARARNAGFAELLRMNPGLGYVQFVDGDCELASGWLAAGREELERSPNVAVVCGRLRERNREASIYNRLCDMEWAGPPGDILACGGIAMFRVELFRDAGGFRDGLAAGEEPELCLRLRETGGTVRRLPIEMGLHDAAMTRFREWWKRATRAGHAYAECSRLHRAGPLTMWNREVRSAWFWGLILPAITLIAALFQPWFALLLLGYAVLAVRIERNRRRGGDAPRDARLFAAFCVMAKFAHTAGQLRFHRKRLFGKARPSVPRPDVAYLVNQYPSVSHSFIRREIRALEELGVRVERFSVRRASVPHVDPADREEQQKTQVLLDGRIGNLLAATVATSVRHPLRMLKAVAIAFRMGWRSGRGLHRHAAYLAEACVLVRRLRRSGVRHVHAHFGTNSTDVALLASVLGGVTYSFTVHGPEEFDRPTAISLGLKIERAKFVAAISDFGRSQLYRWCSLRHWPRIHVIRCGLDKSFLGFWPLPPVDTTRIVCVGRLCEQKGQLLLLQAISHLRNEGTTCELVLAGDGPMRREVEAEILRLGLGDCVQITGWLSSDEVRTHLIAARVLVLASFAEGLPVVLMESLALGRAVVTTSIAGHPELVDPACGWLVPAGSATALANAIHAALETPVVHLAEMGRIGFARVAARHDASKEAARLAGLLVPEGVLLVPVPVELARPMTSRVAKSLPSLHPLHTV